jgi:fumarate reductase (CoM/CoB) subunit B
MGSIAQEEARRLGQTETGDSQKARLDALREGSVVTAVIRRFDPSTDRTPYVETYRVPYSKWMRVLDVLNYIAEDMEQDLAYRWACGVKKCGTCAVRVNGREVLACWESAVPHMVIEPLRHLSVVRDLVVDRAAYEARIYQLSPWLARGAPYTGFPERLPHHEMLAAVTASNCVSCMACYSACPVLDLGDVTAFSGPAPLVQMAQAALDPRDTLDRGQIAADKAHIFECVSCYRCEEVCPVGIPIVTGVIEPLKAKAYQSRPKRHQKVFNRIIERRGRIDPSLLVLGTQGLRALLHPIRVIKLMRHGKINLARTLWGAPISKIAEVRRLFARLRGSTAGTVTQAEPAASPK